MRFTWINGAYLSVPLTVAWLIWRFRHKSYYGHSLLAYLEKHIGPPPLRIYLPRVLEIAGALCLCIALLDPIIPVVDQTVKNQGHNMVLVVDLSSSMQMPVTGGRKSAKGHEETRLEAVKSAIVDFISHRKGDRLGVVVFSNNAYVVTPLTLDYKYVSNYVQLINERTLSDEGMTAIGEGLLQANDILMRGSEPGDEHRGNVIVLLTDGDNNTGRPVDLALKTVRDNGIRTYVIGVEVETTTTVQNQGFLEAPKLLEGVKATGGRYYDARDAKQLNQSYDEINSLEKGRFTTKQQLRDVPAFSPFAIAALLAFAAGLLLRTVPALRELS
jgi:Ca-activated chloride channel family protein